MKNMFITILLFAATSYQLFSQNNTGTYRGDKTLPSTTEELNRIAVFDTGIYRYSVEDFFQRPAQSSFQVSPDGKYFSYAEKDPQGKSHIYIKDIVSGIIKRAIEERTELVRGYFWVSNTRLLYYKDKGGDENYRLFAVDIDGTNEICLTPYEGVSAEVLRRPSITHPDEIIVLMNKDNPEVAEPCSLNIYTGKYEKLFDDSDPTSPIDNYYFDKDQWVNVYINRENRTSRALYYRTSAKDTFTLVFKTPLETKFEIAGFAYSTPYPHDAYIISNIWSNTFDIVLYDLKNKKVIKKCFSNDQYDLNGISVSNSRNYEVEYYSYTGERSVIVPVSQRFRNIYKKIAGKLKGYDFLIYDRTTNEDRYLLDVYSDKVYHKYYLYNTVTDELTLLVNLLPQLREEDMAENRPITFISRDGLTIHGYVTIPNQALTNAKVPLIVNPHGGPYEVRNEWSFNREAQLFASRGYATLQVNYRGSGGYGKKFQMAGYKQIGRKMLEDLEDAVSYVKSLGFIDGHKVAIYGGSYGGLAALGSLVKTPDLYRCAVDNVGISDLFTFYKSFPPQWQRILKQTYTQWYDPDNPEEEMIMKQVSPALNADKIIKPVFVTHGANDPRVDIEESDRIVKSLRAKGLETPYMVKYDEGHGFSRESNRIEMYKTMLGFFAKYLK